jgi:RNase P/RNase MRP subunit POP5
MKNLTLSKLTFIAIFGLLLNCNFLQSQTSWVKEMTFPKNTFSNSLGHVLGSVVVNDITHLLISYSTKDQFTIVRIKKNGSILSSKSYTGLKPVKFTHIKNELFVVGIGSGLGRIMRISDSTGNITNSLTLQSTEYIFDGKQMNHNKDYVIIIGRNSSYTNLIMAYSMSTNTIVSSLRYSSKNYGYGLAVTHLNDNILVGTTYSNGIQGPVDICRFTLDTLGVLSQVDIDDVNNLGSKSIRISTNDNSLVDCMTAIPNTDNVIFSYPHWNKGKLLSAVGILKSDSGSYSIDFGTQKRFDYGSGQRGTTIAINKEGTFACIGQYVPYNISGMTSNIGFHLVALKSGGFDTSKRDEYFSFQVIKNKNAQIGSMAVSSFDTSGKIHTAISIINSGVINYYFGQKIIDYDKSCYTTLIPQNMIAVDSVFYKTLASTSVTNSYSSLTGILDSIETVVTAICSEGEQGSIQRSDNGIDFKCHPNPANKNIIIDIRNISRSNSTIEIYDLNGRVKYTNLLINSPFLDISVEEWASGLYLVRVVSDNRVLTKKIIVNHD